MKSESHRIFSLAQIIIRSILIVAIILAIRLASVYLIYYIYRSAEKPPEYYVETNIFQPTIKVEKNNITLYIANSTLKSFRSSLCPNDYPNKCFDRCYGECETGYFYCYPNGTAVCKIYEGDVIKLYSKLLEIFKGNFSCSENIKPSYVEEKTLQILPKAKSNQFPYVLYIATIYNWTKNNIRYVPGYSSPKPVEDVLKLMAGNCIEQANLVASMVASIGGVVRIRESPACQHGWAEVFVPTDDVEEVVDEIDYYIGAKQIEYFADKDGMWIPLDTAGADQIGKILGECLPYLNETEVYYYCKSPCESNSFYYNNSCYSQCPGGTGVAKENPFKCLPCPKEYPYTFNNTCINNCPMGTGLATDGKTCVSCPKGYTTYNNTCVKCPNGYYLGSDGKCYPE